MKLIAIGPNTWGAGQTLEEACENARGNWNGWLYGKYRKEKLSIYVVEDDGAMVNDIDGSIHHRQGTQILKIQTSTIAKKGGEKHGFGKDDGKQTQLDSQTAGHEDPEKT